MGCWRCIKEHGLTPGGLKTNREVSFFTIADAVGPDFTGKARSGSQCFIAFDPNELLSQGVELYISDEVFLTGTAAEVTPVREIDRRVIGEGRRGPIAQQLQEGFFRAAKGQDDRYARWLTYV